MYVFGASPCDGAPGAAFIPNAEELYVSCNTCAAAGESVSAGLEATEATGRRRTLMRRAVPGT